MRTVGAVLREQAEATPDAVFLVCDEDRLTYGELLARSTEVARGLVAAGAGRGTHVGMLLPNSVDFAVIALAIMRIGAVAVPLSTLSSVAELETLIVRADLDLLIAATEVRGRRFDELIPEAVGSLPSTKAPRLAAVLYDSVPDADGDIERVEAEVRPTDPVVIVHTSGSTSAPKGVVHAHGPLVEHLAVLNELRAYGPEDVLFSNSPFFWIGGFAYTFLGTLVAGATVLCSQQADPAKVLDMMERERPTMCNGYAASATALAADPSFARRDLSSMTRGNLYALMPAGSVPADPALRTNMLGMTEGGSVVMTGTAAEAEHDLAEQFRGSFGRPTPDLEARIVDRETGADCVTGDIGELWLRGPAMMLGYYGVERSETFDADGWFHTGDLVHRDQDDHWYFHGRGDDMIKTAGANVSPAEVQDAVLAATGLNSIALGIPDPAKGEVVALAVLADDDTEVPDAEAMKELLAPLLSTYKVPRRVRALKPFDLPLRSSGKVDLAALRDLLR